VRELRDARIGHGRLNANSIVLVDGQPTLTDFQGARLAAPRPWLGSDLAEMLVSLALLVGNDRALAAAFDVLGSATVAESLPYLQGPALTPDLRNVVRHRKFNLEALRTAVGDRTGGELPEIAAMRRVSVKTVVLLLLVSIAVYSVIAQLADVGLDTIV